MPDVPPSDSLSGAAITGIVVGVFLVVTTIIVIKVKKYDVFSWMKTYVYPRRESFNYALMDA